MGQNSQPIDYSVDMFPKTPEAAALSKHIDIPPGNYTGVANFTIPLYTINLDGENIPIELSYTTTGIKVGEIASRVGLGWSLNTGPSLTQQVIGDYDLSFKKPTLMNIYSIPEICQYHGYEWNDPCGIALSGAGLYGFNIRYKPDSLPDVFSYSLMGSSGTFIFDYSGMFGIPRPYNLTKISPYGSGYTEGIKMIDEKGFIYNFGATANIFIQSFNTCNMDLAPDAVFENPNFKISKIESPKSTNKIEYTYGKSTHSKYTTSVTEQYSIYQKLQNNFNYNVPLPPFCINFTESRDPALTEISFKGGKIQFYYNNDIDGFTEDVRQDLFYSVDLKKSDVYLTKVIVSNEKGEIIKNISLQYSYFESNDFINQVLLNYMNTNPEIKNGLKKRLKLTSVIDNLESSSYKLKYFGDDENISLPSRVSFSQDYWGVYNGKSNSTSVSTVTATNSNGLPQTFAGADKTPNITYGKIGNLKKISYPNGGYTEIEYEADDYFSAPETTTVSNHNSYNALLGSSNTFTIPQNSINKKIIFIKTGGTTTVGSCGWKLNKQGANPLEFSGTVTGTFPRDDEPGDYLLSITPSEFPEQITCEAFYEFDEIESVLVSDSLKTAGTIRVSKISSFDENNGKIIRQYEYKVPTHDFVLPYVKSSGINHGEEKFVSLAYSEFPIGPEGGTWGMGRYVKQLKRINNPGWQTNTVRGKSIGYEYVQEYFIDENLPGNSFKKEYKFQSDEYGSSGAEYNPYTTNNISWPVNSSLDDGLLLEERYFNNDGHVQRFSKYTYDYDAYFNTLATMNLNPTVFNQLIGKGLEIKIKNYDVGTSGEKYYHFNKADFDIKNYWIKNVKTTTTEYINNQPAVVTEQTTAYSTNSGQNRHTYPESQTTSVLGNGVTLSKYYKYAHDINNYLKDKNIISAPLETEVKKNGVTISKTETKYPVSQTEANTKTSGLPLLFEVLSKDLQNSTMEKEITYDIYDTKGNLLQYTIKGGVPTAIIWDYNQTHPIAKIEGAKLSDIPPTLITNIVNASDYSNPTYSESTLITQLDAFRTSLSAYQVSTYTYKPLIGVTSITPPSGIREYYFYDTANRLQSVKDSNGNVLKEYQYNYKP